MKRVFFLFAVIALSSSQIKAQVELQKVAPLSPNAAAITKYGEIPVSYFTGVPSVSVPLYTIQSKSLSLPLALNYHAGGIKVEEIASWVGLGWSLGTIPTITRSVNGLPDEAPVGGYYRTETYDGLTMKEIEDSFLLTPDDYWVSVFRKSIYNGDLDPEADLYFFSLPSRSGKFWWNQDLNSFQTAPKSEIKIEQLGNGFRITDEDGTVYVFYDYETSQSSNASVGPIIKSAWYVNKIYNANRTDSINFSYGSSSTLSYSISPYTHTLFGDCPSSDLTVTNSVFIRFPDTIRFNNGYVKLLVQDSSRKDYNGGYALDKIRVYSNADSLIRQYKFKYHYLESSDGSSLCSYGSNYEKKRLMLDEVEQLDKHNVSVAKHAFLYDSTIASPCRLSTAQDYWGFYNGQTGNDDLIPRNVWISLYGTAQAGNADRNVYPAFSQFGMLRRIKYPTGGYSDFEYENNTAYNASLPLVFTTHSAALQGEAPFPITTDTYIDTFTVNNIPNVHLNGGVGGAFLTADIGAYGCDLSGGSSPCASFTIRGIDAGNSSYFGTVLPGNTQNWYVPNGNYEIKAHFDQDTPAYDEFWFYVTWLGLDSAGQSQAYNRNVGGLRIKKVQSFDNFGKSTTRRYKYSISPATDTSSGAIFGSPHFVVTYHSYDQSGDECYSLRADPNAISVSHAGSYTGYTRVFEYMDSTGAQGMSEYQFDMAIEGIVPASPFPPPESQEYARGNPILVANYKFQNGTYYPVKRTFSEYLLKSYDSIRSVSYKLFCVFPNFIVDPGLHGFWDDDFYYNTPTWSGLSKQTERIYDQNDTTKYVQTVTDYTYNSDNQLAQTQFINSIGDTIKTKMYYPKELNLAGSAETARQALITQNNISAVLKQESYNNTVLTNEVKTNYKHFGTQVMPEEIFQKIGSGSSESRIKFLKYSPQGNLLEQQKTNDIVSAYLWDYANTLPIAEIINADSASIAATSFEADGKGGWTYSGSISADATSPTGSKCYLISGGNITRSGLTNTSYTVSYWGKNGNVSINGNGATRTGKTIGSWTYYEHDVTATSITVSGSNYIDELRLYPAGAHMTTFTYDPLVGITSQCDPMGKIAYFEYDNFGRLKLIKDQDKNIIKVIEYKYQQTQNQ